MPRKLVTWQTVQTSPGAGLDVIKYSGEAFADAGSCGASQSLFF